MNSIVTHQCRQNLKTVLRGKVRNNEIYECTLKTHTSKHYICISIYAHLRTYRKPPEVPLAEGDESGARDEEAGEQKKRHCERPGDGGRCTSRGLIHYICPWAPKARRFRLMRSSSGLGLSHFCKFQR